MKRILLSLIFTTNLVSIYCQNYCFEDGPPLYFVERTIEIAEKHNKQISVIKISEVNPKCHWSYYLRKSSYQVFSKGDSSSYYLDLALTLYPKQSCRVFQSQIAIIPYWVEVGQIKSTTPTYFSLISNKDSVRIKQICEKNVLKEVIERSKNDYSPLEKRIMQNDQELRLKKIEDWTLQNERDHQNRVLLDSIFDISQSLSTFSSHEVDAFSLVLHHSEDCEWNFKWFRIFLTAFENNEIKSAKYLGIAFDRMFNPKKGNYCREERPIETEQFIDELRLKYTPEFAQQFGYDKY